MKPLLGRSVVTPVRGPALDLLRKPAWRGVASFKARVDSFVTARVAQDLFSGVVAVARDGKITYQRATGIANRSRGIPMALDTKLQLASITKLFTQIAILQLEQTGRLSLSDTVGKFLPDYPNATVRSKVTVDQLFHHRSGVGSFWNAAFMARHAKVHTVSDYLTLFDRDSLMFEPGTREEYSNGGYVLLGAIIERVSGQSYHDYVRTHIFQPAGMTSTMPYDNRHTLANAAIGYTSQSLDGPIAGDQRRAGGGSRPGYGQPNTPEPVMLRPSPSAGGDSANAAPGFRLRIMGADGRELSPEEARNAVAERSAEAGAKGGMASVSRHPNTATEAGTSGPAGDDFSTAADFIKLANALVSHHLLDSARTSTVLGARYRAGGEFRIGGGGPGVNAEFSIFPAGDVVVVLSNYDPPAATTVAQFIRSVLAS
ncbi:MAG: beta-lactamase family protein, partial [Gemmatimonadota bacterium]|nr:beta-lactamase family protein [Gemmatimonadota bacterium]